MFHEFSLHVSIFGILVPVDVQFQECMLSYIRERCAHLPMTAQLLHWQPFVLNITSAYKWLFVVMHLRIWLCRMPHILIWQCSYVLFGFMVGDCLHMHFIFS
jgi:hypothetical protein